MYVNQLSKEKQAEIKAELTKALSQELKGIELTEAIEDGMNSKLHDLSEVINIKKYL